MAALGKLSALGAPARKATFPRDGANQERANDGPSLKVGEFAFHDVRKVVVSDTFKATAPDKPADKPADKAAEGQKGADKPADKPAEGKKPADQDKLLEKAKIITASNGVDEIFFRTENGDLYVAAFRGTAEGVKNGYLGRYGGQKVEIVHVDDESNTFREGLGDIFTWTRDSFGKAAGQEATKAVGTVAGTIVGGLIAAAAVKGSAAPLVAAAATGAATNAAAVAVGNAATQVVQNATAAPGAVASAAVATGTAAAGAGASGAVAEAATVTIAGKVGGAAVRTVGTARAAIGGAFSTVSKIGIPVLAVGGVVFGLGSLVGGWNAYKKKANFHTIDMITGEY